MKKIILLTLLVVVGILGAYQAVLADNSVLSALPAVADNAVGTPFNVLVQLNPANNKVCVIKGTLVFDNLTCKNITVASGIMTQTTPTCEAPSFTLGIPSCSTKVQNILSVSVLGSKIGKAGVNFSGVKVIGEGTDVVSSLQNAAYNIVALQNNQITQQNTQSAQQIIQQIGTEAEKATTSDNGLPESVGAANLSSIIKSGYFLPLLIIFVIVCIGYGVYYFVNRKKNKE